MDKLERVFELQAAFNDGINKSRHLEAVDSDEWVRKFSMALIVERCV